jgi:CBS domain-containing protein
VNEIKVKDVMTHFVVTALETDPIKRAAVQLIRNHVSGAPVLRDRKVVGVISETDIARALVVPAHVDHGLNTADVLSIILRATPATHKHVRTVADVMSSPAVTIGTNDTLFSAARLMERYGVKRLPVTDDAGELLGVISRADLVRAMTRSDEDIRQDVTSSIAILGPESLGDLTVSVDNGVVTVAGGCDRRSTRDIAVDIAGRVPGVSEVVDHLDFDLDDASVRPPRSRVSSNDLGSDPWAVGPLVKGL